MLLVPSVSVLASHQDIENASQSIDCQLVLKDHDVKDISLNPLSQVSWSVHVLSASASVNVFAVDLPLNVKVFAPVH